MRHYYRVHSLFCCFIFFFNDTATTEIYTLSLHDALPIFATPVLASTLLMNLLDHHRWTSFFTVFNWFANSQIHPEVSGGRSEEHTSELQSRQYLVCRLLLEKKKNKAKCHNN